MTHHQLPTGRHARLKSYVFFRPTGKGVWFDAGRRSFELKGAGLYALVEKIVGLMDDGHALEAIEASLPERLRPILARLVGALDEYGMLDDVDPTDAPSGNHDPADEWRAFLRDQLPPGRYATAVAEWLAARVVAVGDGFALKAAVRTLAQSGCGRLDVFVRNVAGGRVGRDEIEATLQDHSIEPPRATCHAGGPEDEALAGCDLVVFASDDPAAVDDALRCDRWAREHGVPALTGTSLRGRACIAPPAEAGLPGLADLVAWMTPGEERPSPAALGVMGAMTAHAAVCHRFGIRNDERRGQALCVTPHLESTPCAVIPAPGRGAAEPLRRDFSHRLRLEMPEGRDLRAYERLRLSLAPWFDPLTGAFGVGAAKAFTQLPLYHDAIDVRLPGSTGTTTVIGWGLDAEEAGLRAVTRALAQLASAEFGQRPDLFAAADADAWRVGARALAVCASGAFARQARHASLPLGRIDHPKLAMMARILDHFALAEPRLHLSWLPGHQACRAALEDGAVLGRACAAGPAEAAAEAIGEAISTLQLGRTGGRAAPALAAPAAATWQDCVRETQGSTEWPATFHESRALGLPDSVHCGYAELEGGA